MKKVALSLAMTGLISSVALAQFDEVKTSLAIQQYKKAKEQLDALLTKPKNAAKPEAYILKATVVAYLMNDPANEATATQLRSESIEAYKKYLEMDPAKPLVADPVYANAPIGYYSSFFNEGIKGYNKKDWTGASASFKNTVEWSDFIIANKLAKMEFDTTANLLAGAAFQNAKQDDAAIPYFTRLTDKKIGGDDNEFVYQFLMGYYFKKDDAVNFDKYKALGKELYPKSEYFTFEEIDFIMSMEDEAEKTKRIEAKIAKEPGNLELLQNYGFILFDKLNAEDISGITNYAETEEKMIKYLQMTGEKKPDDGKPFYYLGNHFINKAVKVNAAISKVSDEIRKANSAAKPDKTGKLPPPPKELTDKREALRKAYSDEVDKGLPYLEQAAAAYGKLHTEKPQFMGKGRSYVISLLGQPKSTTNTTTASGTTEMLFYDGITINLNEQGKVDYIKDDDNKLAGNFGGLKGMDLQNYKRLVDQLILIYGDKKAATKVPADKAKFEAEEKKWNAIYTKIAH